MTHQRYCTAPAFSFNLAFILLAASSAAVAHSGPHAPSTPANPGSQGPAISVPGYSAPGITRYGDSLSIGKGRYHSYVKTGRKGDVVALGVKFHRSTLDTMPTQPDTDASTCYDLDNNNAVDLHNECVGGHSRTLYFNANPTPFKSITINWEPHGHVPAGVYDSAHFDFHFYMIDDIERKKIIPGTCPGLMNCAVSAQAALPIPAKYVHPDFFNTNLVYAHMGNHYADGTSPEFHGKKFSHTFILGSFAGKTTFYEPMVASNYLKTEPDQCTPIKQPQAFATAGYYPTRYCIRYDKHTQFYDVFLAGFRYRAAS